MRLFRTYSPLMTTALLSVAAMFIPDLVPMSISSTCGFIHPFRSLIRKGLGGVFGAVAVVFVILAIFRVIGGLGSERNRARHFVSAGLAVAGVVLFGGGSAMLFGVIGSVATIPCIGG